MYEDRTSAEVIADSVWDGVRLVTFRATFPRFILAEVNTHRAFSRNSASSRAIPLKRQIELVEESPFIPQRWPKNQPGMQAREYLPDDSDRAYHMWCGAKSAAVTYAKELLDIGVHKQIAARILEPYMWHSALISSTMPGLDNFFAQRDHEDAQPEMQTLARAMRKALDESEPLNREDHIPFFAEYTWLEDLTDERKRERFFVQSVARCARVSYGREMEEKTYEEDVDLVIRLLKAGHASPFEHVSVVLPKGDDPCSCEDCHNRRLSDHLGNFQYPFAQLRHHWREYLPTIASRLDSENH